jgi:hypothetical protein
MVVISVVGADGKDVAGAGETSWWRRRSHDRCSFFLQSLHQDALQPAHIDEVYGQGLLTGGIESG